MFGNFRVVLTLYKFPCSQCNNTHFGTLLLCTIGTNIAKVAGSHHISLCHGWLRDKTSIAGNSYSRSLQADTVQLRDSDVTVRLFLLYKADRKVNATLLGVNSMNMDI